MMTKTRIYLFLSLALLLMAVSCGKKKADPNLPAKLVFEQTDLDLGTIYYEDGPLDLQYTIRNDGGQYLYLVDVVSTCDCTTPEFNHDNLYGGDAQTIKVTFNPQEVPEGDFERMIGVFTNLTKRPDTLYFHGVVKHK